ncbi:deoxyribonuclease-1-like isoform 2-T2 [Anableps anableps]
MKIAAFNVQKFGRSKVSDPDVLKTLVKIISRYDIIVILEVVDATGKSVDTLMQELNEHDRVELVASYQSDDEKTKGQDNTDRDPYILRFRCPNTVLEDLVIIPVHTKPEDAKKELDELYDLFLHIESKWRTDNVMILGDFNADGLYVSKKAMETIRIRSNMNFHWLIGDDVDTTVSAKNTNTYDRIVVYGDDMLQAVVPNSAKAFNFQEAYNLSTKEALKVSDHYPVEVMLVEKNDDADGPEKMEGPNVKDKNLKAKKRKSASGKGEGKRGKSR